MIIIRQAGARRFEPGLHHAITAHDEHDILTGRQEPRHRRNHRQALFAA